MEKLLHYLLLVISNHTGRVLFSYLHVISYRIGYPLWQNNVATYLQCVGRSKKLLNRLITIISPCPETFKIIRNFNTYLQLWLYTQSEQAFWEIDSYNPITHMVSVLSQSCVITRIPYSFWVITNTYIVPTINFPRFESSWSVAELPS